MSLHQTQGNLMMKVGALAFHLLMCPGKQYDCLPPSVAAFFAPRDTSLRGFERPFRLAIPTRMEDAGAIGEGSERLKSQVYACVLPSWRKRLRRHVGA